MVSLSSLRALREAGLSPEKMWNLERKRKRLGTWTPVPSVTPVCPSCGLSEDPERRNKGQSHGSKGRWNLTYRKDLRTFHLPRTPMEESEMARLRPWPGSGFREEPRSSQFWISRLQGDRREASGWCPIQLPQEPHLLCHSLV